jgi:hypothetical protein
MPTVTAIAHLECGQLRVAVGTEDPEILACVVRRVTVDVVHDEDQRQAVPFGPQTANGAPSQLLLEQIQADVVAFMRRRTVDVPRGEPASQVLATFERSLALVAAELAGKGPSSLRRRTST